METSGVAHGHGRGDDGRGKMRKKKIPKTGIIGITRRLEPFV